MNLNYLVAVLVLIILVLGYYSYQCYLQQSALKGELGKKVAELDALLLTEAFEASPDLKKKEERRNRIEAKLLEIQALQESTDLKPHERVKLRVAVAKADDYLADSYVGEDKESVLQIRRLRDAILAIAASGRSPFCKHWLKDPNRIIWEANLRKMAAMTTPELTADILLPDDATLEQIEKYDLIMMYRNLNNAVCSTDVSDGFKITRGNIVSRAPGMLRGGSITKEQLFELVDALEPLILKAQKNMCPDSKLNAAKIQQVYERFMKTFCQNDEFLRMFMSDPIEHTIKKTYSLFE